MRLYFTTVIRGAAPDSAGEVVCLDWDTKTVLASATIGPLDKRTPLNPRGGTRGGRGVAIEGDRLLVLGSDVLYSFALDLSDRQVVYRHRGMNAHELLLTPQARYISATGLDAVITTSDRIIEPLLDPRLVAAAKLEDHLHLNATAMWRGHLLALLNRPGLIVDLTAGTLVMDAPSLLRAHSLTVIGDTAYVVATHDGTLCQIDLPSATVTATWPIPEPRFARGLAISGDRIFVGNAPLTVIEMELGTGIVLDSFHYKPDELGAIHGIAVRH